MTQVLVGADPELFWTNEKHLVSIIGKLGGNKHRNIPIDNEGNGVLEDNVAAEFNIPPANNAQAFVQSIQKNLIFLKDKAASLGLSLAEGIAAASFPREELDNPEAWIFGCEPDYNAWSGKMNMKPEADDPFLRSCGGHVHVGCTDVAPEQLIRAMDIFLGVESTKKDRDTLRRKLYGKHGAFRYKPYGAEYRTLSNFWIWDQKETEWVFNQTQKAVAFAKENHIPDDLQPLIEAAIDLGDESAYTSVITMFPMIK